LPREYSYCIQYTILKEEFLNFPLFFTTVNNFRQKDFSVLVMKNVS
jgi:hypothetical protein